MLAKIIEFIQSIWNAVFRRNRPTVPTVPTEPAREPVSTIFDNRTSFTVDVYRMDTVNDSREACQELRRGQSYVQPTLTGQVWTIVERTSKITIASFTIDVNSTHLVIDAATPRPVDPGGEVPAVPETELRFRNPTHLDVNIVRVRPEGPTVEGICPAGHSFTTGSELGEEWHVETVEAALPAGFVPGGLELGRFLCGSEPRLTCEIENTLIAFENDTMLVVECFRVVADGSESLAATLAPGQYGLLANQLADRWRARDARSGYELGGLDRVWSAHSVLVGAAGLHHPIDEPAIRRVLARNSGTFHVSLERLDEHGAWRAAGDLAAGTGVDLEVVVGGVLRAVEPWTGTVVGMFIVTDEQRDDTTPDQIWPIELGTPPGEMTTLIEVSNDTHLTVDVLLLDFGEERLLRTLPAHGRGHELMEIGAPIIVRDQSSRAVMAVAIADRLSHVIRIDPGALRSRPHGTPVTLTLSNATEGPVEIVSVDDVGAEHVDRLLQSDESATVRTMRDCVWRVRRERSGDVLHELITGPHPIQESTVKIRSTPGGRPTTLQLVNRALLRLDVLFVDELGNETSHAMPKRGEAVTLDTHAGASWIVREPYSRMLVDAFVAGRRPRTVEVTDQHLRSTDRGRGVDAVFINDTNEQVELVLVGGEGSETIEASIPAKTNHRVSSNYGYVYRVTSPGFDAQINTFCIPDNDRPGFLIDTDFVRKVDTPDAALYPGEIALYEQEKYLGTGWVLDRDGRDLGVVPNLGDIVGSVRVGPRTIAELHTESGFGGQADEIFMDLPTLSGSAVAGTPIRSARINRLVTAKDVGITSRSDLVEDYRKRSDDAPETYAHFRTTITVPPAVKGIDVWAEELVTISAGGTTQDVDLDKPMRLTPNQLGRVLLSVPATGMSAPGLTIRTNTMAHHERLHILPDAALHERVANLPDGELHSQRQHLGITASVTEEQCSHVQMALQSLARTAQHSYEPTEHGVHQVRRIGPEQMSHPHWQLDMSDGGHTFRPLSTDEVSALTSDVRTLSDDDLQQGIFGAIGSFVSGAAHVVVHTAVKVGTDAAGIVTHVVKDVGDTTAHIAKDVTTTAEHVGKDLARGDVVHAMSDIGNGTLSVGDDIATGALHVGGDLAKGAAAIAADAAEGAKDLAVVTIKFAEGAVQFVLDHTGKLGELIGAVLEKIGAAITKALSWLMSKLGLDDMFATNVILTDAFVPAALRTRLGGWVDGVKQQSDGMFDAIDADVDHLIDVARTGLHLPDHRQEALPAHHSDAMDKIEWVFSHLMSHDSATTPTYRVAGPPTSLQPSMTGLVQTIESQFQTGAPLPERLAESVDLIHTAITGGIASPPDLLGRLLDIVEQLANAGIELVKAIVDMVLDLVEEIFVGLIEALSTPLEIPIISDVYEDKTGQPLTALSIITLTVAAPMTIAGKADAAHRPFPGISKLAAGSRPGVQPLPAFLTSMSAASNLVLTVTAPASTLGSYLGDAKTVKTANRSNEAGSPGNIEMEDLGDTHLEALEDDRGAVTRGGGGGLNALSLLGATEPVHSFLVLAGSMPSVVWEQHRDFNPVPPKMIDTADEATNEGLVLLAPDHWGDFFWSVQVLAFLVDVVVPRLGSGGKRVLPAIDGVLGVVQIAAVLGIGTTEKRKIRYWKSAQPTSTEPNFEGGLSNEDRAAYLDWGNPEPHDRILLKTAGNTFAVVPPLFHLGLLIKNPELVVAIAAVDGGSHLLEGIILYVRLGGNEMF